MRLIAQLDPEFINPILQTLAGTPLPTILLLAGVGFLVLAVANSIGGRINLSKNGKRLSAFFGITLAIMSVILYSSDTEGPNSSVGTVQTDDPPVQDSTIESGVRSSHTWGSPGNLGVPSNAFQAGNERDGTPRYLCRVNHRGSVHPGKVVSRLCNIAVIEEDAEYRKKNYEVLTDVSGLEWVNAEQVDNSTTVLVADEDSDRKRFICRATWEDGTHPGEILNLGDTCYVPYNDTVRQFTREDSYELLVVQQASE